MRADRLLSILLLLQVNKKLTAGQLARRLEVSPRTIHRDMEALSMAGVPVYAERGGDGGWVLPDSFRTEVTGLTDSEVQALFLAAPARLISDLGLERAADGAWVKVLAALPSSARRDAEFMRQRIHIDGAGWHADREAVPALAALQEALWLERRVRIRYGRGGRTGDADPATPVDRVVDPLGLVAKGRLWYLVAAVGEDLRTYRVSRVHNIEILAESSSRPTDFDLAQFWTASSAQFLARLPSYTVLVRVAPEAVVTVRFPGYFATILSEGDPDADGWRPMTLDLQTEENACRYALGLGTRLEVVEPLGLRAQVAAAAQEIARFYGASAVVAEREW